MQVPDEILFSTNDDRMEIRMPGALKKALHEKYPDKKARMFAIRSSLLSLVNGSISEREGAAFPLPATMTRVTPDLSSNAEMLPSDIPPEKSDSAAEQEPRQTIGGPENHSDSDSTAMAEAMTPESEAFKSPEPLPLVTLPAHRQNEEMIVAAIDTHAINEPVNLDELSAPTTSKVSPAIGDDTIPRFNLSIFD